jgi:hypothetical protein
MVHGPFELGQRLLLVRPHPPDGRATEQLPSRDANANRLSSSLGPACHILVEVPLDVEPVGTPSRSIKENEDDRQQLGRPPVIVPNVYVEGEGVTGGT